MNKPKYIMVVKHGDILSNIAKTTSFGIFKTWEDADAFRYMNYGRQNYICEILPINDIEQITLNDSAETRAERLKQSKISSALSEMRNMAEEEELLKQQQWNSSEEEQ